MRRLMYSSVAVKPLSESDLAALLRVCRLRNGGNGITGLLVHVTSPTMGVTAFVQMLEGERSAIEHTYARIERDGRHQDLSLLVNGAISQRQFGDWTMRLEQISLAELEAVVGRTGTISSDKISEVLRDLTAINVVMSRYT